MLAYVQCHLPTRATDVGHWIGVGPAALRRQVVELEGSGLFMRSPCPTDARAQLISFTGEGAEEISQAYGRRAVGLAELLQGWDGAEISVAATTVDTIQAVLRVGMRASREKDTSSPPASEEDIK
ncbi:hypothetical protein GCM10025778_02770 [Paeniglutamicibacter antarcticus]|uniref:HTH marR-type domain-containing protein n=1 Tax=Paeniglutamicibacter antarcticus TaxID=494023 RepID=A0ABP9TJ47_9MICC